MKITFIKTIKFVFLVVLLTACLPQEKTTQCGSGEAFNPTERRCVSTLANSTTSISIATITPDGSYAISTSDVSKTHTLTVSDPYNLGYSLQWYLTRPTSVQTLVSTGSSYTVVHSSLNEGTHILEARLYDQTGSQLLDSRSWTISVITDTKPVISAVTPTPITTETTQSAFPLDVSIANVDGLTVDYAWYVNGGSVTTGTFNTTTCNSTCDFSFDPTSAASYYVGSGIYTVQLILYEDNTTVIYDSYTWTIQNNLPGFATVTLGDYTTNYSETGTTPSTAYTINAFSAYDFYLGDNTTHSGLKYDSDADGFLDKNVDLCVEVDNYLGVNSTGVFVDFLYDGVAIPNATGLQFTANATPLCMAKAINDASSSVANKYTTTESESAVITAVVYDAYSGATIYPSYGGGTEIKRYNWNVKLRALNTAPRITIDNETTITTLATSISCTSTGGASPTTYSGCSMAQYDPDDAAYNDDGTNPGTTYKLAILVEDDDYDPYDFSSADVEGQHFKVVYKIGTTQIDNATQPVTTPPTIHEYSESDCVHDYNETLSQSRYVCDFTLLSYGTNGPIDPTGKTYTVEAYVIDQQSPYAATASNESNTVRWVIDTVTAAPYDAEVQDFDANTTASYLELPSGGGALSIGDDDAATGAPSCSGLGAAVVKETDKVNFNIATQSNGRDSHYYKVFRCSDNTCATQTVTESAQDNSTEGTDPRIKTITVTINEDAVTGTDSDNVYYRVDAFETASSTTATDSSNVFCLPVQNYNPYPTFDTSPFNAPAQNTTGTPMVAVTGFPVTIDPGVISDSSGADGEIVKYQWAISTTGAAGSYSAIDGATDRILYWSPGSQIDYTNQQGQQVFVKLCIGDDGYDGGDVGTTNATRDPMDGNDCRAAAIDSGDWYFEVFSNMNKGYAYDDDTTANTSSGEIAVWIDPSTKDPIVKYMAYANQSNEIVVEKYVLKTDAATYSGSKSGTVGVGGVYSKHSIIFPSISSGTGTAVSNLSMTGDATNGSLYIAYQAAMGSPSKDYVHIRRIDISGGKTNSSFVHDGKFSFDAEYNGLANNLTVGNNLTELGYNANDSYEVQVDDTANNTGATMTVQVAGLHGSTSILTNGTDFCTAGCATVAATATAIANAINDTSGKEFQGLTATASGAVITIEGIWEGDYLEEDLGGNPIGDIMVNKTAGQWMLPFVNSNATGSDQNKIAIAFGDLGEPLSLNDTITPTTISATSPSQEIANDIIESDRDADSTTEYNDNILIATRELTTGNVNLYELDSSMGLIDLNLDVFDDDGVYQIDLSISQHSDNENAYLMGRNGTQAYAYARISHTAGNFDLTNINYILKLDDNHPLWESDNVTNYDIMAGSNDNEVLFTGVDSTNEKAYILKISGDTTVNVSCNPDNDSTTLAKCQPLSTSSGDTNFNMKLVFGDVLPDVTMGSAGGTASENINDLTVVGFHIDDGGGSSSADAIPVTGIINTSGINLSGDDTAPGNNYVLPYVND